MQVIPKHYLQLSYLAPRKRKASRTGFSGLTESECIEAARNWIAANKARFLNAKLGHCEVHKYENDPNAARFGDICMIEPFQPWRALTPNQLKALLV